VIKLEIIHKIKIITLTTIQKFSSRLL